MTNTDVATFAAGLFALANPLIRVGPYLQMTGPLKPADRRRFLTTGMAVMLIGYLAAVWFGRELLELVGVTIPSLNAAGGAVIIALAFPMVLGSGENSEHDQERVIAAVVPEATWRTQAIVPFGVPLLVGGGSLAYLITATAQFTDSSDAIKMSIVSLAFVALMAASLHYAPTLSARMGYTGSLVIGRLFGFVLLAIGFSIFTKGLTELMPGLAG